MEKSHGHMGMEERGSGRSGCQPDLLQDISYMTQSVCRERQRGI